MRIELTVNGVSRGVDVEPMARLLDVLRNDLRLTGTKEGCGEGECGACSVIMDGKLVNSCLVPAIQAAGSEITTIEGIGTEENPSALQTSFVNEGAIHCGFCTPGMIVAAQSLLTRTPNPDRETIRKELSGNICRCTGYEKIYKAIEGVYPLELPSAVAGEGGFHDAGGAASRNGAMGRSPMFSPEERGKYFSPATLREALDILKLRPNAAILAGATDVLVDARSGRAEITSAVDISRLPELRGIRTDGRYVRIGSCVTNDELENDRTVSELLPALSRCASLCGGPAVQNRATIGGNICTASGAGDLPVVLLALSASVLLACAEGEEQAPLEDFVTGYRRTTLRPGQIVKEVLIPLPAPGARQAFFKRGSRKALTLSRVSFAAYVEFDGNRVSKLNLAAGSMSPVPVRLKKTEAALMGGGFDMAFIEKAAALASEEINPRKQTEYRKKITGNLVRRFLKDILADKAEKK